MTRKQKAQAAAIIEKAADIVSKGWCQGAMARNEHGLRVFTGSPDVATVCAIGGVFRATKSEIARDRAIDALGEHTPQRASVSVWNDRPGRTKRQVVNFMRRVAKKLREEAAQ